MPSCTRDYDKDIESVITKEALTEDAPNFIKYNTIKILDCTTEAVSYIPQNYEYITNPPEDMEIPTTLVENYNTRLNTIAYTYTRVDNTVTLTHYDSDLLKKNVTVPVLQSRS